MVGWNMVVHTHPLAPTPKTEQKKELPPYIRIRTLPLIYKGFIFGGFMDLVVLMCICYALGLGTGISLGLGGNG